MIYRGGSISNRPYKSGAASTNVICRSDCSSEFNLYYLHLEILDVRGYF